MLSLFASYCRNQQFMRQIIRKPFNPFCLSDSDIPKHIKTLIELREKRFQCRNSLEEIKIDEQILPYDNDLNSYLKKFMVHQTQEYIKIFRDPYYLFRKHLVKLAYQSYYIDQNLAKTYIESAMCGDYENHYKDELMKQVFLAELYGIKLRINYSGQEEEFAAKSLAHWQNVVENHCQFYKQWEENQSFDIDAFTKNMEVVYYDQYLECYVAVLRELYQCGVFEKQKTYFEEAQTKIEEAIKIILYLKEKIAEMNGVQLENYQEFVKKYESQFNKHLVNSYISQIKTFIFQRKLKYGIEELEKILKKNIANSIQIFHLQILQLNLEKLSKQDNVFIKEKVQPILDFFMNNKETQQQIDKIDKQFAISDFSQLFLLSDLAEKIKESKQIIETLEQFQKSIELQLYYLESLTIQNCFNYVLELSCKQFTFLIDSKYTKHYFWDSVIFSLLFAVYIENDVEFLQLRIHSMKNTFLPIIERPQDKIVKFFQLIVELEMISEINQVNQDILQKIEQIEFEQPLIKHQKKLALEKIYKTYNLKQDLIQKNN